MSLQVVQNDTPNNPVINPVDQVFQLEIDESKIAWLTFDYPGEKVNKFSAHVMTELNSVLDEINANKSIRCLVIKSAKKGIFIAGADVKEIMDILQDAEAAEISNMIKKVITNGVSTFNKLESLHCPSIAVIDGACMGGGLEMALACTYRVATDDSKTSLALPEVNLGIIPGWGGTQRLTRMVGWRKAKELLLTGVEIDGKEAEAIGLINKAVPIERVDEEVDKLCARLKHCAPVAWGYTKLAMNKVWETDHKSGLDYEVEALAMVTSENEFNQNVFDDFINDRQPKFERRKNITCDWD